MAETVAANDVIVVCGTSITSFGWFEPLKAMVDGRFANKRNAAIARFPAVTRPVWQWQTSTDTRPTWVSSGISGNTAADIEGNVAGRITNYNPTMLILEVGVNDAYQAIANATFTTKYTSIITQSRAAIPTLKIVCVGILCKGEDWPTGANAYDTVATGIDPKNVIIQDIAAANTATYVDVRTPWLAYVTDANTAHAASGFWTSDDVHPNQTGKIGMSTAVFASLTVPAAL